MTPLEDHCESATERMQREEEPVCPLCATTVALLAAGATSSGGLTALAVKKLHAKAGTNKIGRTTKIKGGQE